MRDGVSVIREVSVLVVSREGQDICVDYTLTPAKMFCAIFISVLDIPGDCRIGVLVSVFRPKGMSEFVHNRILESAVAGHPFQKHARAAPKFVSSADVVDKGVCTDRRGLSAVWWV
ncbi:hypothetical protein D3C84_719510 [compost metagenome]